MKSLRRFEPRRVPLSNTSLFWPSLRILQLEVQKKAELVYYRTMVEGMAHTAFMSCQALASGIAPGILSAYKRVFSAAGLEVNDWIPKVMWFCADGATMMQDTRAGVFSFLHDLQQEICGWSVVVQYMQTAIALT